MAQEAKVFKLYDQSVLLPADFYEVGNHQIDFKVFSGSRMMISLYIKTINPGSNVTIKILNSFSLDEGVIWEPILTFSSNTVGWSKRIATDFNKFFRLNVQVLGDDVELMLGISIFDNSDALAVEGGELLDRLNKLVPEVYDDVEVMTETPGKQPILVEFRRNGSVVRTIECSYVDEVFRRARII